MKKTLFSSMAVIAIVGAALAFSPVKKQHADIYTEDPATHQCNLLTQYKEDNDQPTITLNGAFTKTPTTSTCPTNIFQARVDE